MKLVLDTYDAWVDYLAKKEPHNTMTTLVRRREESRNIEDSKSVALAQSHVGGESLELTKLLESVKPVEDTNL